jgi:hypothetical protein
MKSKVNLRGIGYIHYKHRLIFLLLFVFCLNSSGGDNMAFPGALGWGGETRGAWGLPTIEPIVLKVTSLSGGIHRGTLRWALDQPYPRIVVFEVGGVINFGGRTGVIQNPYVTVAGQTAPSPGITIVNGALRITNTHDVIVQHLMIRPGAGTHQLGWEPTGIVIGESHSIIIDHCSVTWSVDENITLTNASEFGIDPHGIGTRTQDDFHNSSAVVRKVTISNTIAAECLDNATHRKGPHSKGMMIRRNANRIAILRNLIAHNVARNPLFQDGISAVFANNYIYNYFVSPVIYHAHDDWSRVTGVFYHTLSYVGNVLKRGPNTPGGSRMLRVTLTYDVSQLYLEDFKHLDRAGEDIGEPIFSISSSGIYSPNRVVEKIIWHSSLDEQSAILPSSDVVNHIANNVGARPWDRDPIDQRIVNESLNGAGSFINHEREREGLPNPSTNPRYKAIYEAFVEGDWELRFMLPYKRDWDPVAVTSPINGTMDHEFHLVWDAVENTTHYNIQIATDNEFSSLVVDKILRTATLTDLSDLIVGTTYYWRVKAMNSYEISQWSDIRLFTMGREI